MNIFTNITDSLIYEKEFNKNKNAIELVRFNSNYDKVIAHHDKENLCFRFFKELNLKRNDKLIDNHDNIYFVDEVIVNQPYLIKKRRINIWRERISNNNCKVYKTVNRITRQHKTMC